MRSGWRRSSLMTGAILMASGLVPNTLKTVSMRGKLGFETAERSRPRCGEVRSLAPLLFEDFERCQGSRVTFRHRRVVVANVERSQDAMNRNGFTRKRCLF